MFTLPVKRKLQGSTLYRPNARRYTFSTSQEAWIVFHAAKCKTQWTRGQKILAADAFEFEPTGLDLWDEWKDEPEFAELRALAQEMDADVRTDWMPEDSALAVED